MNHLLAAIQNPALVNPGNQANPDYVSNVVQNVFSIFMIVGLIYFVWHFLFAGYHFIAAQGDEKQYQQAKSEITYAAVGLIVVFIVFAMLKMIGYMLGIQGLDSLQFSLPSL